jgi:hypothetical protein
MPTQILVERVAKPSPIAQSLLHHNEESYPSGGNDFLLGGWMATGNRLVRSGCFVFRPGINIGVRGEQ